LEQEDDDIDEEEESDQGEEEEEMKNGHCEYSHDPEDVRKFKAAQTLGKQGIRNIAKNLPKQGSQPKLQQRYKKTHWICLLVIRLLGRARS